MFRTATRRPRDSAADSVARASNFNVAHTGVQRRAEPGLHRGAGLHHRAEGVAVRGRRETAAGGTAAAAWRSSDDRAGQGHARPVRRLRRAVGAGRRGRRGRRRPGGAEVRPVLAQRAPRPGRRRGRQGAGRPVAADAGRRPGGRDAAGGCPGRRGRDAGGTGRGT